MERTPVLAVIGSRDITDAERELIIRTARWCASRGFRGRSGGAKGADQAWEEGWASVDPELFTAVLPRVERRRRSGVCLETPPYPRWAIERAVAEWTFGERLPQIGLPPYEDPTVQARFEARRSWRWLEQKEAERETTRRRERDPRAPAVIVPSDEAYVQQLMIRNACIVCPTETESVNLVLGLLNARKGGGGTGHAFRLAAALGVPAFNLRDARERAEARQALEALAQGQRIQRAR